ncbi:MAG: hypothetical protein ABFE13_15065 [Phycisphaerales bacterium]
MSLCWQMRDRRGARRLWFIDTDPYVLMGLGVLLMLLLLSVLRILG